MVAITAKFSLFALLLGATLSYVVDDEIQCNSVSQVFTACVGHNALLTVNQSQNAATLLINASSFTFIVPYAFKNLGIINLVMDFGVTCPKVIFWPDAFRGLPSLRSLFINHAVLDFTWYPFKYLKSLTHLSLLYSFTSKLPPEFLSDLPNLKNFTLMRHNLTEITTSTFSGASQSLEHLALYYGHIGRIQLRSFERLRHLKYLSLFANPLMDLQPGTFAGLNELEELDLRWTKMTIVSKNLFRELNKLKKLQISNSAILYIEYGSFDELRNLEELNLSFNVLTHVKLEDFNSSKLFVVNASMTHNNSNATIFE